MRTAAALAAVGAIMLVAGATLAAWLMWDWRAALASWLLVAGAGCLYAGLVFDLGPKRP